jgi:hypothetical protein
MGHAVQEVRRPVERIDDPAPRRVGALDIGAFLAEEPVIGPCAQEFLLQDLLGRPVRAADEIAGPLGRDLQVLHLAEILHQAPPRLAGGLDHDVEIGGALHVLILRVGETPARYRPARCRLPRPRPRSQADPSATAATGGDDTMEFWVSIGSTYSYLTVMRIDAASRAAGVEVTWRPFNVRDIMVEQNNIPFATSR